MDVPLLYFKELGVSESIPDGVLIRIYGIEVVLGREGQKNGGTQGHATV